MGVRFDVSARSAPAENALPAPVSTTTFTALSCSADRKLSASSSIRRELNALSALGRSSVISRIPLLSLIVSVSICFFLGNE